jgi:dienelactone hydrolase
MKYRLQFCAALPRITLILAFFVFLAGHAYSQTTSNVKFQTEDGWTISGTLYLPKNVSGVLAPAVLLLPEPGWVDRSIYESYLSSKLAKSGMAALSIDVRGTGGSSGGREFDDFSPEELGKLQLDVRGAIKFLSSQKAIDPRRIGIVGSGITANNAVSEAAENSGVQAIVLISGDLNPQAMDLLKSKVDIPALFLVGKKDKKSLRQMAEGYILSENQDSDLLLALDHGPVMFSHTAGLEEQVVSWLGSNLKGLGTEVSVTFKSADGWTLHGLLRVPDDSAEQSKMPGVVLVHGAKHDEQTYYHLAREAAKKGLISLRFDGRGKGESSPPGKEDSGAELSAQDQKNSYLDIRSAIEFLASQKKVNSSKIGIVAATAGCANALKASLGDSRIQTLVLLTSTEPNTDAKQFLTTSDVPILAVASTEDNNYQLGSLADFTREVYRLSKSKGSQLILYDDAGRGSEMFKVKRELQPMVVRWLTEKLGLTPPGELGTEGITERSVAN